MMVSGCFGLLWAFADRYPDQRDDILDALGISGIATR
jgi:hypothetical protein